MGKYPLTYEEYEKKLIDLFVSAYPQDKQETIIDRLNDALKDDPNLIKGLYGDSCFRYNNPKLYGDNCKKVFEDYYLQSTTVNTLHMLLGGESD